MSRGRVSSILNTYFHRPAREYARLISRVRQGGGLTSKEIEDINAQAPFIHASAIIRHAGLKRKRDQR